jgi:hypothetical protein
MGHVDCEQRSCRYNSLRNEVERFRVGVCETDILIRDKGWGPQCRGYDEVKECFGGVSLSDENCLKCEDLADCTNLTIKKAAKKETEKT